MKIIFDGKSIDITSVFLPQSFMCQQFIGPLPGKLIKRSILLNVNHVFKVAGKIQCPGQHEASQGRFHVDVVEHLFTKFSDVDDCNQVRDEQFVSELLSRGMIDR